MKKILILAMLSISSVVYCQMIKPLTSFYSDPIPNNGDGVIAPFYYKDIDNYFTPFIGTWKSQVGSNTFVVTLWKETQKPIIDDNGNVIYYIDNIYGNYKMIQNYGTQNELIIYSSQVNYFNSTTQISYVIYADSTIMNKLSGVIYDTNTMNSLKPRGVRGFLLMNLINISPNTASWIVTNAEEINTSNFVIPTNITLIKQ